MPKFMALPACGPGVDVDGIVALGLWGSVDLYDGALSLGLEKN